MATFLALQHTDVGIEVALFNNEKLLEKVNDDKKRASRNIMLLIEDVMKHNEVTISDLDFISVNQGPGPFTTLRVVIASANGLAYATKKPLIGIDGLDALMLQYSDVSYPVTVGLLNAYGGDLYFAVRYADEPDLKKGYKNSEVFFSELKNFLPKVKIQFIGGGCQQYKDEILSVFTEQAVFDHPDVSHCSMWQVGVMALEMWKKQEGLVNQIQPLYLKDVAFKKTVQPSSF